MDAEDILQIYATKVRESIAWRGDREGSHGVRVDGGRLGASEGWYAIYLGKIILALLRGSVILLT